MKHRNGLFVLSLTGLLLVSPTDEVAAQPSQQLGMLEVNVQVDGLSCPFCAYGLEKKLRGLDNVASLEIKVSEGRAVLNPRPGTSLNLEALEQAVRDGGFTPRGLTLTARGRLTELHGTPALELTDGTVLLLAEGGQSDELSTLTAGATVRVKGRASLEQGDGHAAHPYTLTVDSFEVSRLVG